MRMSARTAPLDAEAVIWSAPSDERDGRPLVVMMHGYGGIEQDLADHFDKLPERVVAASVRGSLAIGDRWGWLDRTDYGAGRMNASARGLLAWLDDLPEHPSTGLVGFSQGGALAMQLFRLAPRRFDYGVQLSGFIVEPWRHRGDAELADIRPPFFSGHGDLDDVIPPAAAASAARWLRDHTTLTERRYADVGHEITEEMWRDIRGFVAAQL